MRGGGVRLRLIRPAVRACNRIMGVGFHANFDWLQIIEKIYNYLFLKKCHGMLCSALGC
jgi:hypothetical protein